MSIDKEIFAMNIGMTLFIIVIILCWIATSMFEMLKELIAALLFYGAIAIFAVVVLSVIWMCLVAASKAFKPKRPC